MSVPDNVEWKASGGGKDRESKMELPAWMNALIDQLPSGIVNT